MTPEEIKAIENRLADLVVAANAKRHDGQLCHIRGLAAQTDGEVRRLSNEKRVTCLPIFFLCKCGEEIEGNKNTDEHQIVCPECQRRGCVRPLYLGENMMRFQYKNEIHICNLYAFVAGGSVADSERGIYKCKCGKRWEEMAADHYVSRENATPNSEEVQND